MDCRFFLAGIKGGCGAYSVPGVMQMICAWKELLAILPPWMRYDVDRLGKDNLQELRLRINAPPELIMAEGDSNLERTVCRDDLNYCVNAASGYSPWTAASVAKGYLTAPGGHRIGLCGEAICKDGKSIGIKNLTSLCIRIARDFPGIAAGAFHASGSILILGAPGWGKTTLLRDLCRQIGETKHVGVVDERKELFPSEIPRGKRIDVMSGCAKILGMDMILRTMGPSYIAVDEITAHEDCEAMVQISNCGVKLLATAHAASIQDYYSRSVYRVLVDHHVFDTILLLHPDKSYTLERVT